MTTPVRSVPPTDGAGAGALWAGEKRRKTVGEGPPQVQEEQGAGQEPDESVFSAEDNIDNDEVARFYDMLYWRESFFDETRTRMGDEDTEELYKRLCLLRYRDYKILKGGQDWDPTKPCPWDSPFEPGPSIFGWTYDPEIFNLNGLSDYQRIVPTRDFDEYPQYDAYRSTLCDYRTDKEYVKYYDEISKKIKWVEEYMRRDKMFEYKFERTGHKQSMKIATGFPHLTMTLAKRGYKEYILDLAWKLDTQDYVRVFLVVWQQVFRKKEMRFEDALRSALPVFGHSCNYRIMGQLNGYHNLMVDDFFSCMAQIPEQFADEDKLLMHMTDAVYKIRSPERPKLYLDYVKKKIEVLTRASFTLERIENIPSK